MLNPISCLWRLLSHRSSNAAPNKIAEPSIVLEWLETSSAIATVVIFLGIALEFWATIHFQKPEETNSEIAWKLLANALIGVALLVEAACIVRAIFETRREKRESDEKIAEANARAEEAHERAAKADLARAELETKLQPRMTDQRQFDLVQTLHGRIEEITIGYETDAETWWFAESLRGAFFGAGIRVALLPRAPEVHSFGMLIYDPGMVGAKLSEVGEVLVDIFRGTGTALAMIGGLPTDVPGSREYPAIIVGGRFLIPPAHIVRTNSSAKNATRE